MRRLLIIPALLFGLAFSAGGYFFLDETSIPMWQDWQRMQDWRPANARLISVHAAANETRADYRYEYAGSSYQGERVGVTKINDNIGAYHRDMQSYLRQIKRDGTLLPIWVNPLNPAEAVIDREMRWGLFAFSSLFCSVFIIIGLSVIFVSLRSSGSPGNGTRPSLLTLRKAWKQAQAEGSTDLAFLEFCNQRYASEPEEQSSDAIPADWKNRKGWETSQIKSEAVRGSLTMWIFALVWNVISTPLAFILPGELQQQNYAALVILLFPVVGLFLLYKAIQLTLEYRQFGSVIYNMDPYPGGIGGHVGGSINVKNLDYRNASDAQSLQVRLECVYSYVSGSGKNRSRSESIKWAQQGQPKIDNAAQGVNLVFRFDVPGQLPPADVEQSDAYHFWRLGISAEIPGIDLERSYNIPVFATAATAQYSHHDISAQAEAAERQASDATKLAISSGNFDIEGLSRALKYRNEGNRIQLSFPMFRNRMLTLFAAIFAGGFGFASYSIADMASAGGLFGAFLALFGIPFFLVALLATIALIYLPFNNLRVRIEPGEVSVLRRLLFIPVYHRRLGRANLSHLSLKRSGSTGQGIDKIEHFKIRAHDNSHGKVTLAEDIDGLEVATHLRDYLAQRIGVTVKEG